MVINSLHRQSILNMFEDYATNHDSDKELSYHDIVLPVNSHIEVPEGYHLGNIEVVDEGYYEDDEWIEDIVLNNADDMPIMSPDGLFVDSGYIDAGKVLKFKNVNIDTVIALARSMYSNGELIAFGMLLTDCNGNFFNPLNAVSIYKASLEGRLPFDNFTIVYYPLSYPFAASNNGWCENIMSQIELDNNEYKIDIGFDNAMENIGNKNYYELIMHEQVISNQPQIVVTAVSMVDIAGIIYPYYGAIESVGTGSIYKSKNLFPMMSGNVSNVSNIGEQCYPGTAEIHMSGGYGDTCIGKYSNSIYTNLKHMNTMNAQSMYDNYVIPYNWYDTVVSHLEYSLKKLYEIKDKQ